MAQLRWTAELATQLGCRIVNKRTGTRKAVERWRRSVARRDVALPARRYEIAPLFREEIRSTLEAGRLRGLFRFQVDLPGWGCAVSSGARTCEPDTCSVLTGIRVLPASLRVLRGRRISELPLMEDVELCRSPAETRTIRIAPSAAVTSGRRWKRLGAFRNTAINQCCIALYRLGVSVERIARSTRNSAEVVNRTAGRRGSGRAAGGQRGSLKSRLSRGFSVASFGAPPPHTPKTQPTNN